MYTQILNFNLTSHYYKLMHFTCLHTHINIGMCHTDSSWPKERDIHMFKPFMIYIVLKMFFIVSFVLFKLSLVLFQSLIHSEEVN